MFLSLMTTILQLSLCPQHGDEGIQVATLRMELEEEGLMEHVPKRRMEELLRNADRDGDKNITYEEFCRMVSHKNITYEEMCWDISR